VRRWQHLAGTPAVQSEPAELSMPRT
jgi:hypothetical protein